MNELATNVKNALDACQSKLNDENTNVIERMLLQQLFSHLKGAQLTIAQMTQISKARHNNDSN